MKKNVEAYMSNDLLALEENIIEKKIMHEGFDYLERRAAWQGIVADTFAEIDKEEAQKTQTRRFWQYAAAALVLTLAAFGIWAVNTQTNKQTVPKPPIQKGNQGDKIPLVADVSIDVDKLLTNSVDGFQATTIRKGSDDTDAWQTDFQLGRFNAVIRSLESVGKKRTAEQCYLLAHAYLKMNPKNTLKAQPLFKLVSAANSDYAQDALWAYALICLLHKENDAAKVALSAIINDSPLHVEEAQRLKNALK